MEFQACGHTDVGQFRQSNEDAYLVDEALGLFVVADGVGGQAAGEVASDLTCKTARQHIEGGKQALQTYAKDPSDENRREVERIVQRAIHAACQRVYRAAQADNRRRGMASTVALVLLVGEQAIVAHVGDSRVYLVRAGQAHPLTEDHSLVAERVRRGEMTRTAAARSSMRSVLNRAIGHQPYVEMDALHLEPVAGDTFILCSDGLYSYVKAPELAEAAANHPNDQLPAELTGQANARGGADNITTLAVTVTDARPVGAVDPLAKIEALRSLAVFRHLTYKQLHTVLAAARVEQYAAGEPIVTEGRPAAGMYVMLTGTCDVGRSGRTVTTLEHGASFAELALFDDSPQTASVTAKDATCVLAIDRDAFADLLRREPRLSVKLLWCFCRVLEGRLRQTDDRLSDLEDMSARPDIKLPAYLAD
ncbi:MAG: cyclic nucleotide-binding domain-containing protein [Planctomycetes bacterium]|jgi:serine/threonine protein phosphatase PrpC|nr:cyclic nucleotide-binding domain-containing protein [Planctomycetota bacterium]